MAKSLTQERQAEERYAQFLRLVHKSRNKKWLANYLGVNERTVHRYFLRAREQGLLP